MNIIKQFFVYSMECARRYNTPYKSEYRTGRIKNIRGRERLKFTVHFWEFHKDFLAHADRHIDRLSKHHRRLYRQ